MKLEKNKKYDLMDFVRFANTFHFFDDVIQYTRRYRETYDCAHDESHSYRVFALAVKIALLEEKVENPNLDVLLLASFFHDLISPPKNSGKDMKDKGMNSSLNVASKFLEEYGFPKDISERVIGCIEQHSFSRGIESDTTESKIFSDADKLDAVGYSGILRMVSVAGSLGLTMMTRVDGYDGVFYNNDNEVALDHINKKIKKLRNSLYFDYSRELYDSRFNDLMLVVREANMI